MIKMVKYSIFTIFAIILICVHAYDDSTDETANTTTIAPPTTTPIYDDANGRSSFIIDADDSQLKSQGRIINDEKISIKGFIPIVGLSSTNLNNNNNNENTDERNNNLNQNENKRLSQQNDNINLYDDQYSSISLQQHQTSPEDQRFIGSALQGLIGNIGSFNNNNNNRQSSKKINQNGDCICVPFYMCRNGILSGTVNDPYNNLNQQRLNYNQQLQQPAMDDIDIYAAINERSLDSVNSKNDNNNTNSFAGEILGRMLGNNNILNRQMTDKCGLLRTCCQRPYNLNEQQLNIDYLPQQMPPMYRPPPPPPPMPSSLLPAQQLSPSFDHIYSNHHQSMPMKNTIRPPYNPRPMATNHRPPKVINTLYNPNPSLHSFDDHSTALPIPIRNDHLLNTNHHTHHHHHHQRQPSSRLMKLAYNNCGQRQSIGINGRVQNLNYHQSSTEFAEFPWQVAILKRIGPSDNLYVCGGALISSGFVMTAAHCIKKFQANDLKIRLGEWDVHREDEFYAYVEKNVEQIFVHPDFVPRTLANDVALLKLDIELDLSQHPHISPICMPQSYEPYIGQRCYVAGWGKNAFGNQGEYQSVLMKVDLPVIERRKCESQLKRTKLGHHFRLDRSMICAGGEPGKDACEGDGGSGLVCETPNGIWNIIGLVSWGLGCGQNGVPGVYTNVAHVRQWIDKIILPYYANNQISKPFSSTIGSIPNFNELINERSMDSVVNNNKTTESSAHINEQDSLIQKSNNTIKDN